MWRNTSCTLSSSRMAKLRTLTLSMSINMLWTKLCCSLILSFTTLRWWLRWGWRCRMSHKLKGSLSTPALSSPQQSSAVSVLQQMPHQSVSCSFLPSLMKQIHKLFGQQLILKPRQISLHTFLVENHGLRLGDDNSQCFIIFTFPCRVQQGRRARKARKDRRWFYLFTVR